LYFSFIFDQNSLLQTAKLRLLHFTV